MPEEAKNYLNLEESSRDTITEYLISYISCLEGILEDRDEQLKNTEYKIKKIRGEKTTKKSDIELLEEEISSIKVHIGLTKGEIVSVETAKAVTRYYPKIKNSDILCNKTSDNISS